MTTHHISQLRNATSYEGLRVVVKATPRPKLKTGMNRGFFASMNLVEMSPDRYDWTIADAWVDGQIAQGLTPILCMSNVPAWRKGSDGRMDESDQWQWAYDVGTRYKGKVHHWEWFNEFDTSNPPHEFDAQPDYLFNQPEQVGRACRIAHDALHYVDPANTVILGSVQSLGPRGHGLSAMRRALAGFNGAPQAVAVHCYVSEFLPLGEIEKQLDQLRGVLIAGGAPDAKMMVTEWGMDGFGKLTRAERGTFLRAAMRQFKAAGVESSHFLCLESDGAFGFPDDTTAVSEWNAALSAVARSP